MKVVNDIWRQLVGRRLLPVALILVAALVAVPIVLAKDDQPASEPALKPVDAGAAAATKTIVSLAEPATKRRVVLGAKTNPFAGEKLPKPKVEKAATPAAAKSQSPDGGAAPDTPASPQSGGSPPAGGTAPSAPSTPATPAPEPKTYDRYELTVRFGSAEGSPERRSLKRLAPLPSADEPVLIYLGVLKDGKTAQFLLDDGVSPVGDGECHPGPEQCETIRLKAGETEFFDVADPETGEVGEQYQLDLVKIHKSSTASATQARASSKAGRRLLKARASSAGYRSDTSAGGFERGSGKTLRATFAGATVALP